MFYDLFLAAVLAPLSSAIPSAALLTFCLSRPLESVFFRVIFVKMLIEFEPEFGYVALVVVACYLVNVWMIYNVIKMRKQLKVGYPNMYDDNQPLFNCYQRVHQNSLEMMPVFLVSLILGGCRHPLLASIFGCIYLLGRVVYAVGYYSGKVSKRMPGVVLTSIGLIPLVLLTVSFAAGLLGWW
jgi:glutathione S-transferase